MKSGPDLEFSVEGSKWFRLRVMYINFLFLIYILFARPIFSIFFINYVVLWVSGVGPLSSSTKYSPVKHDNFLIEMNILLAAYSVYTLEDFVPEDSYQWTGYVEHFTIYKSYIECSFYTLTLKNIFRWLFVVMKESFVGVFLDEVIYILTVVVHVLDECNLWRLANNLVYR